MEAYLDNSATTRCYEEVRDVVVKTMMEDYGNPSAMHLKGVEAENYVKEAKNAIAATLKVAAKEIFFTSGGTESDNWALIGTAMANKRSGNHIITTAIEHSAVSAPLKYLEEQGFEITRLSVDNQGVIRLEELEKAIRPETILVSTMYVNNEIGAVEPVEKIAAIIHQKNPKTLYHVDAIQGYGKYQIYPNKVGIDMLSVSGHKIHGPKGVGFLYVRNGVKITPMILGGGQQMGMRSGTDNVPGIAGLGVAAKQIYQDFKAKNEKLYELKGYFIEELQKIENVHIHGMAAEEGAPHIISVAFVGVRSEVLLHTLEDRGIFVSAGSACSTHKRTPSATMMAIRADQELRESTVRFSFSEFTTKEEIDYTLEVLKEVLPMLRKFSRK